MIVNKKRWRSWVIGPWWLPGACQVKADEEWHCLWSQNVGSRRYGQNAKGGLWSWVSIYQGPGTEAGTTAQKNACLLSICFQAVSTPKLNMISFWGFSSSPCQHAGGTSFISCVVDALKPANGNTAIVLLDLMGYDACASTYALTQAAGGELLWNYTWNVWKD